MKSIKFKLIVAKLKHLRANIYIVACEKNLVRGVDRGVEMVAGSLNMKKKLKKIN